MAESFKKTGQMKSMFGFFHVIPTPVLAPPLEVA